MDDAAYRRQIEQMCSFIQLEATEKANEIAIKTEHDFNLEKQMLVHNAKLKLQGQFKQKRKDLENQERITRSNQIGACNVRKMVDREEIIVGIKEACKAKIAKVVTADAKAYKKLLHQLLVQGMLRLNETKIEVRCRKADIHVVESVMAAAAQEYAALIKKECDQVVACKLYLATDEKKFLPPAPKGDGARSCAGGMLLAADRGRVVCDNTLDSRLEIAFEDLKPQIRATLWPTLVKKRAGA